MHKRQSDTYRHATTILQAGGDRGREAGDIGDGSQPIFGGCGDGGGCNWAIGRRLQVSDADADDVASRRYTVKPLYLLDPGKVPCRHSVSTEATVKIQKE